MHTFVPLGACTHFSLRCMHTFVSSGACTHLIPRVHAHTCSLGCMYTCVQARHVISLVQWRPVSRPPRLVVQAASNSKNKKNVHKSSKHKPSVIVRQAIWWVCCLSRNQFLTVRGATFLARRILVQQRTKDVLASHRGQKMCSCISPRTRCVLASHRGQKMCSCISPRTKDVFLHLTETMLRFHHILNKNKRKVIIQWAKELGLGGASKIGYPGEI